MILPEAGHLLRIYISETDQYEGKPLHEWIIRQAREYGLAGATVIRGMEGYGAHSRIHHAKLLRLSEDLPILIEIVDIKEKIEGFLPVIDMAIQEGLVTVESVEIRLYRPGISSEMHKEG